MVRLSICIKREVIIYLKKSVEWVGQNVVVITNATKYVMSIKYVFNSTRNSWNDIVSF